jgi:hypothetical protein
MAPQTYANTRKMQNIRMLSSQNSHFFTETPHYPQKIVAWAAISQRKIIGPYFFQGKLL